MLVWLISWNDLEWSFASPRIQLFTACHRKILWMIGWSTWRGRNSESILHSIYVGKPWTWWSKDREGLRVASTVNGHRHRIPPLPIKQSTLCTVDGLKVVAAISSIWERLLGCETAVSHWQQITSSRICFKNSELDIQSILGGGILWLGSEDAQSRNWQLSWFIWAMFSFLKTSSFRV